VWAVLANFARYPEWNPFILQVEGEAVADAAISYRFEFPRHVRIWTRARVLRATPERELRWSAHFLSRRVFNGEHYFQIVPTSESGVVFRHGEIFTGLLLPLAWPILRISGPRIYRGLNEALKQRAERATG
jgi:hypothetical protein